MASLSVHAVSYTHLDVYKRQGLHSAVSDAPLCFFFRPRILLLMSVRIDIINMIRGKCRVVTYKMCGTHGIQTERRYVLATQYETRSSHLHTFKIPHTSNVCTVCARHQWTVIFDM